MPDLTTLTIVFVIFIFAGMIKGVIGLGLPTVSLGLLSLTFGLQPAMTIMLLPSLVTNIWQALAGVHFKMLCRQHLIFFLTIIPTIWIGTLFLSMIDPRWLLGLLGALTVFYALAGLKRLIPSRKSVEGRGTGFLIGALNGFLTGLTGSFVVPGTLYLQAQHTERNALIQAMGILFTLSTFVLAVSLQSHALLSQETLTLSIIGIIPALIGMRFGSRIRNRLSAAQFRHFFFIGLFCLGSFILLRAV